MYALLSPSFWSRYFSVFRCHSCGSADGYVSRPRSPFEKYGLPLIGLRAARCGECYKRSYRPARVPLFPRPAGPNFDPEDMLASTLAAERKVSEKETAGPSGKDRRIA